jgi:hypothetical protein
MDMAFESENRARAGLVAWSFSLVLAAALAQVTFAKVSLAQELKRLTVHETVEISRCDDVVAADEFGIGKLIGDRTLGSVGFNFARLFLNETATDTRVVALQAWTLRYSADGVWLIKHLGGEDTARVSLCSIYRLIEMGGKGGSHTDSQSNFAFARSPVDGRLMAIHWFVNRDDQWVIGAVEVPHPHLDWPPGSRVFSRAIVTVEDTSR